MAGSPLPLSFTFAILLWLSVHSQHASPAAAAPVLNLGGIANQRLDPRAPEDQQQRPEQRSEPLAAQTSRRLRQASGTGSRSSKGPGGGSGAKGASVKGFPLGARDEVWSAAKSAHWSAPGTTISCC